MIYRFIHDLQTNANCDLSCLLFSSEKRILSIHRPLSLSLSLFLSLSLSFSLVAYTKFSAYIKEVSGNYFFANDFPHGAIRLLDPSGSRSLDFQSTRNARETFSSWPS